jgi:hypothetical protein
MSVPTIRSVVEAAIQRAAAVTGANFAFMMGVARRESGFNPNAHARTSSAAGLYQFVDQTWLGALKQHGAKYGYARYADLIQRGADGRYYVPGAEARATVMALKEDPQAAALMAGELGASNAAYLRGRVGREPTPGELYLAHFLGPQGSAKLIDAVRTSPNTPAASLFPDAVSANRPIFYRDGRYTTVAEVYDRFANMNSGSPASIDRTPAAPAPAPVNDFVQYASARSADRASEEQAVVAMILRGPQGSDDVGQSVMATTNSLFSSEMLRALSDAEAHGRAS